VFSSALLILSYLLYVIITPPPNRGAEYCDDFVCLSVCLSLRKHISGTACPTYINFAHVTYMFVARSSSGGVAICYVLPVLWMTSCFYVMVTNKRRSSGTIGSSMDLSPWHILKLVHQGAAPDRGGV